MKNYIVDNHNKKYYGPYCEDDNEIFDCDSLLLKEIASVLGYGDKILIVSEIDIQKEDYQKYKQLEPLSRESEIKIHSKSQAKRIKTIIEDKV